MKLYHYVHCPFCVRVRMVLDFLELEYESIVLPYNDESTPLSLTSVKMLPIMAFKDLNKNESLDIIKRLDSNNQLMFETYDALNEEVELLLSEIGKSVHSLAMPYWIWTPEFDSSSRKYFQEKKEIKRGPFKQLVKNSNNYQKDIKKTLLGLKKSLTPFYKSEKLTIIDIMIASHLWGLYIVPEFQFSPDIHEYLQRVKSICQFDYHKDFWI